MLRTLDLFSKLRSSNKESFKNIIHIGPLIEVNMVLFLRNERFNVNFFISDHQLRSAHTTKHVWLAVITN